MEEDTELRQGLVDGLGVGGWRRQMLYVELEAALYKAGFMKHWEVLVGVLNCFSSGSRTRPRGH